MNESEATEILWNFLKRNDNLPSDVDLIFGLGSTDIRTAQRSAELYLKGYSKKILFSGGVAHKNDLLFTGWGRSEAEVFYDEAVKMGVPKESILLETQAQNTGENIKFGYELLQKENIHINSMILVQKPYMGTRTYATFMKQWPGKKIKIYVTSPITNIEKYLLNEGESERKRIVNIMVGDMQRIIEYPKRNFQIEISVTDKVLEAFNFLKESGYDKHLISD